MQERDAQQAQLNQVQQEIGEKEQQQTNFEQEAKDEEASDRRFANVFSRVLD